MSHAQNTTDLRRIIVRSKMGRHLRLPCIAYLVTLGLGCPILVTQDIFKACPRKTEMQPSPGTPASQDFS
ncbi:MAG: hypothetical protein ACSHX7_07780 [Luteolibacter sp.]